MRNPGTSVALNFQPSMVLAACETRFVTLVVLVFAGKQLNRTIALAPW